MSGVIKSRATVEVTVRTASVIKSLSQLIGVGETYLARMMISDARRQLEELSAFVGSIDKSEGEG